MGYYRGKVPYRPYLPLRSFYPFKEENKNSSPKMEALCIHLKRLMFDHKLFINISLAVGLPTNATWGHFSSSNSKKMCLEIIFLWRDLVHTLLTLRLVLFWSHWLKILCSYELSLIFNCVCCAHMKNTLVRRLKLYMVG